MDKRFVCTAVALLAVITGSALWAMRTGEPETAPLHETVSGVEQTPEEASPPPTPEEAVQDHAYTIREYEGRVAVFASGNDREPEMVLDTLVKYLPDYDQGQLREGIPVASYQELVALIEDFVS